MGRREREGNQFAGEKQTADKRRGPEKAKSVACQHLQTLLTLFQDTITREQKKKIPGRGQKRKKTLEAALMCLFWTGRSYTRVSRLAVCLVEIIIIRLVAEQSQAEPSQGLAGSLSKIVTCALASVVFVFRQTPEKLHHVHLHFKECEYMVGGFLHSLRRRNRKTVNASFRPEHKLLKINLWEGKLSYTSCSLQHYILTMNKMLIVHYFLVCSVESSALDTSRQKCLHWFVLVLCTNCSLFKAYFERTLSESF